MGLLDRLGALLGLSAYDKPQGLAASLPSLGDPEIDERRKQFGGQLSPQPTTRTEFYLADLEYAERAADKGDLAPAARLMRAAHRDGIFAGVLATRTDGLVRLPKTFSGEDEIVRELASTKGAVRSTFDEMFPPSDLASFAADGILLGVGVGEMRPVPGRTHPVFVRLEPEYLWYSWFEGIWYYRSALGNLPITPGDGRWVLHTPGGRIAPWNAGIWKAVARSFIRKENAGHAKDNYEATLANPAIVGEAPSSAASTIVTDWFKRITGAWGLNTFFGLPPGYKISILESNGVGYKCFAETIAAANTEMMICVTGQTVTTDGGTGFANADVHKSIRADLIQSTADGLAFTINSQGLPAWVVSRWGLSALNNPAVVAWDVTPPRDLAQRATALGQFATALAALKDVYADRLDVEALAADFGIPLRAASPTLAIPAPTPALTGGAN